MSYVIDRKSSYLSQYDNLCYHIEIEVSRKSVESENAINDAESAMHKAEYDADMRKNRLRSEKENAYIVERRRADETYNKEVADADDKCRRDKMVTIERMEQSIRKFYAEAPKSIVTMPPYLVDESKVYEAPRLEIVPTLSQIKEQAAKRTYLPKVLVGMHTHQYGGKSCVLPTYIDWQSEEDETTATKGNIMLLYNRQKSARQAQDLADEMIVRMLMSFPIGGLRLSIIDSTNQNIERITPLLKGCEELYSKKVFTDASEIDGHLKSLLNKMDGIKHDFKDLSHSSLSLVQHNKETIKHEYELVILYDPFNNRPSFGDNLRKLLANGISAGIYVMIVQSDYIDYGVLREIPLDSFSSVLEAGDEDIIIHAGKIAYDEKKKEFVATKWDACSYLPTEGELINPLGIRQPLVRDFFESLKSSWAAATKERTVKSLANWDDDYTDADIKCWTKGIEVPIGINVDNKEEVEYRADCKDYVHSFILGTTGSGKSKFLCSIITAVTMKYSPKAVQMYLFDFKDGMAFRCYDGAPHVRWLVTTQADKTMFLTVLQDLETEKQNRKQMFEKTGVGELGDYNAKMLKTGGTCLPHILLVVDECHQIYAVEDGHALSREQKEINILFDNIARQYRSYGIHLLLSSQQIPSEMSWISQVTNNFVLNSGKEPFSKLLAPGQERMTDDIQKRINSMPGAEGVFATIEQKFISIRLYEEWREAGKYIRERAERLLGNEVNQFACHKWTGKLDELAHYTKSPVSKSMEFGVDLTGEKTVGVNIYDAKSNIMLYGAQGDEQAKKLTMRTVLSTLRAQIALRKLVSDPKDLATIYIVNAWAEEDASEKKDFFATRKTNVLEQSTAIMQNLAANGFVKIVRTAELGRLLLQLKKQIDEKQTKSVLLYIIGTEDVDLLTPGAKIAEDNEARTEEVKSEVYRWKQGQRYGDGDATQSNKEADALTIFKAILNQGPDYGIHTVLQINEKNDLGERKISSRDFQYVIFQQAAGISSWPDNVKIELETQLDKLPVEDSLARTLFYNAKKANQEPLVIPFMIDDLAAVAKHGDSVGQYIMDNTQITQ